MTDALTVDQAKAALRSTIRPIRAAYAVEQRAAETADLTVGFLAWWAQQGYPLIASYCACGSECDVSGIHAAIWQAGQAVLLPRVTDAEHASMQWHLVITPAHIKPGWRGIPEPDPSQAPVIDLQRLHLPQQTVLPMLVPGLAFDRRGQRLGQGAGFYDRALAAPGIYPIGVALHGQLVDQVPAAQHDQPMRALLIDGSVQPVTQGR